MMYRTWPEVNRAFSAGAFWVPRILGRCPRLAVNAAPLALSNPVTQVDRPIALKSYMQVTAGTTKLCLFGCVR